MWKVCEQYEFCSFACSGFSSCSCSTISWGMRPSNRGGCWPAVQKTVSQETGWQEHPCVSEPVYTQARSNTYSWCYPNSETFFPQYYPRGKKELLLIWMHLLLVPCQWQDPHHWDDHESVSWSPPGQNTRCIFLILHAMCMFFHISETLFKQTEKPWNYQVGQTREIINLERGTDCLSRLHQ